MSSWTLKLGKILWLTLFMSYCAVAPQEVSAQEKKDYCYVNFINNSFQFYQVYVNGRLLNTIDRRESIKLKVYSEGRISIECTTGATRSIALLDMENGQEYYYIVNEKRWLNPVDSELEGLLKKIHHTVNITEDPYRPFIRNQDDQISQGTCFLINSKGYLLTNHHVVEGAESVSIKGINGDFTTWHEATVVAVDVDMDMALLKLKDEPLPFGSIPYRLAEKATGPGAKAFVLGYPYTAAMGEEIKVTDGIISAGSGYKGSLSQYQFSAPIQPGNSGSPLFNESGEVIGIINSKLRGAENTGYAIKSPYVYTFVNQVEGVSLPESVALSSASLEELVRRIKPFIFIIKAE